MLKTLIPYVNDEMFNMFKSVASDVLTRVPAVTTLTSNTISIIPRTIFVGIPSAWKKDVLLGSIPVLLVGTSASLGANAPAWAGAVTSFNVDHDEAPGFLEVNTKLMLPLTCRRSHSYWGSSLRMERSTRWTMVFSDTCL